MKVRALIRKDLIVVYAAQLVVIVSGFANTLIITNYAGLDKFGQYSVLVSSMGVLSLLLGIRSGEATVKFYNKWKEANDNRRAKTFIVYGLFVDMFLATLFLILAYLFSSVIAKYFLKDVIMSYAVFLFAFVTIFTFLRMTMLGYFQAIEKFSLFSIFMASEQLMTPFLLIYILENIGKDIMNIVEARVFSNIFVFILLCVSFYFYYRREFVGVKLNFSKKNFVDYIQFNMLTFSSSFLKAGSQKIDVLIISYFSDTLVTGNYVIVKKIFSVVQVVTNPVRYILYPKLAKLWCRGDISKFFLLIDRVSNMMLLIGVLLLFVLFVNAETIINYFNGVMDPMLVMSMTLLFVLTPLFWWHRSFSNIVDPKISLYSNVISIVLQVIILPLSMYYYNTAVMTLGLATINLVIYFYWKHQYKIILLSTGNMEK